MVATTPERKPARGFSFSKVQASRLAFLTLGQRAIVVDFSGAWHENVGRELSEIQRERVVVWTRAELLRLARVCGDPESPEALSKGLRALCDLARGLQRTESANYGLVILYRAPVWLTVRDVFELSSDSRVICELDLGDE